MAYFYDTQCPACGKQFQQGDDIVTCPVCGTPQHRACWMERGNCVHADRHAEGYTYDPPAPPPEAAPEQAPPAQPYQAQPVQKVTCTQCGEVFDQNMPMCPGCGARNSQFTVSAYQPVLQQIPAGFAFDAQETIQGERAEDVCTVIGQNSTKYFQKFLKKERTGKKAGWNWCAFLFGPYWYFYRKMWKNGLAVLGLGLTVTLVTSALFGGELSALYNSMYELSALYIEQGNVLTDAQTQEMMSVAGRYMVLSGLTVAARFLVRLPFALYADHLYKNHVLAVIQKTKARMSGGAVFQANMPGAGGEAALGQQEMYRLYLMRAGGVSMMGPFAAYFLQQLLVWLIEAML
ncbi:MAG: DUF2628 domain-containing protein [Clostridiales bacterium]|nr:DUF2628 domain-containing protein [Clostridiales bacterium]